MAELSNGDRLKMNDEHSPNSSSEGMLTVILLSGVILWFLYKKWTEVYSYWESKGFPSMGGSFPWGTSIETALTRTYNGHTLDRCYKAAGANPYIGIYDVRMPILVLKDPEMIRFVMVKEFSHFVSRQGFKMPENDPLAHHLFSLEGEMWRALRVKMTPTFTTGKLKGMFPLFVQCAEALDQLLLSKANKDVDIKDIVGRFTTDTICTCAFGLDVDSTSHEDSMMKKIGASFFEIKPFRVFMINLLKIHPVFQSLTHFKFTPSHIEKFILKMVSDTVEHREKNNLRRNDFMDLLIQLKNKGKISGDHEHEEEKHENHQSTDSFELTDGLLAAQCFVFFLAGFETSSSVQSYTLYELALNPDIQKRLQKEIDETLAKNGGELSYQAVQEMEYLDMVVHETMRKYPTLPILTRNCTKAITLPTGHRMDVGDRVIIPSWSLHHDPQYFPKPDTYDPERFSPENKSSIVPYTYLPFGEGPRICIGMRFGLLQTKVGLITVLRKYSVEPTANTPIPLTFWGFSIVSNAREKINLKVTKRAGVSV